MCIDNEDCDCHLEENEDDDFDLNELDFYADEFPEMMFAHPGGESALRAATEDNPRNRPCPTCGEENRLTRLDEMHHYQCDRCAEKEELGV